MRNVGVTLAIAATLACTPVAAPSPSIPARPTYAYSLVIPTTDLHPGESITMRWQATRSGETSSRPPKVRLCFAIIGPYASGQDAKASPASTPDCPVSPNGAVYVSPMLEADPLADTAMSQDL